MTHTEYIICLTKILCQYDVYIFPKIVVPQNGWFISWKTLSKLMIWGEKNHIFLETSICSTKKI